MRVAVVWPKPRAARWKLGRTNPAEYPDLSDALLYLEDEGFEVAIEESLSLPWNPLVRMHEFYSGLDPLRAARVALHARRYDALLCIGDATAYVLLRLRGMGVSLPPIILIDPALSDGYPRRRRLQDYVLPRVDLVVVLGRAQLKVLCERYGDTVHATFLLNRVDCRFFHPDDSNDRQDDGYVFSIGNDYSRDFETLTKAIPLVECQPPPPFVVHTALPVESTPGLRVQTDRITFERLRELYRRARLVVIPLRDVVHAGGITSLLEAMATGCPIVVSGSCGILDYVVDGHTAVVVEPGRPDALARAVSGLLTSSATCRALGLRAREFVTSTCDSRVYAGGLARLLRETLGRGQG